MAKRSILIVDDDSVIRASLEKVLRDTGYTVELACDGREGLARLEQQTFELLLLDLNLPEVSGFDILDVTREKYPPLRVIILTGLLDQCEQAALVGADLAIEKPPEAASLLKAISELLSEPVEPRIYALNNSATARRRCRTSA